MSVNDGSGNLYRLNLARDHSIKHFRTLRYLFARLEGEGYHKVPLSERLETDGQGGFRTDSRFGWYLRTDRSLSEGTVVKIRGIPGVEAFGKCYRYRFRLEFSQDESSVPTTEEVMTILGEGGYTPSLSMKPQKEGRGHLDLNLELIGTPLDKGILDAIRRASGVTVSEGVMQD